jgi:hypothetical protein
VLPGRALPHSAAGRVLRSTAFTCRRSAYRPWPDPCPFNPAGKTRGWKISASRRKLRSLPFSAIEVMTQQSSALPPSGSTLTPIIPDQCDAHRLPAGHPIDCLIDRRFIWNDELEICHDVP